MSRSIRQTPLSVDTKTPVLSLEDPTRAEQQQERLHSVTIKVQQTLNSVNCSALMPVIFWGSLFRRKENPSRKAPAPGSCQVTECSLIKRTTREGERA